MQCLLVKSLYPCVTLRVRMLSTLVTKTLTARPQVEWTGDRIYVSYLQPKSSLGYIYFLLAGTSAAVFERHLSPGGGGGRQGQPAHDSQDGADLQVVVM